MRTAGVIRLLLLILTGGVSAGCEYYSYSNAAPPGVLASPGQTLTLTGPMTTEPYPKPVFGLPTGTDAVRLNSDPNAAWAPLPAGTQLRVDSVGILTRHLFPWNYYEGEGEWREVALAKVLNGPSANKIVIVDSAPRSWFGLPNANQPAASGSPAH